MLGPRDMTIAAFALTIAATTAAAQVSANPLVAVTGTDPNHCTTENTIHGTDRRCALVVTIGAKGTPGARAISLPLYFARVTTLRITPGAHLVVIGRQVGNYDDFAIYDIPSAQLIANRLCYFPALSPDGTWIAFQRFIPPHGMEGLSTDIEMLPIDATQHNRRLDSYSVFKTTPIPDASRARRPLPSAWPFSPFFWSADSNFLLGGISSTAGEYLVLIRRSHDKREPFIASTTKINLSKVCGRDDLLEKPGKCLLHIKNVTFPSLRSGSIRILFERVGRYGQTLTTTSYDLGLFVPVGARATTSDQ